MGNGVGEVSRSSMFSLDAQELISYSCVRLYYQYKDKNLPFCTAPIHSLLHVVENIRRTGPPCHTWCFSMERFGGWVKRQVTNRTRPIVALTNRLLKEERVSSP